MQGAKAGARLAGASGAFAEGCVRGEERVIQHLAAERAAAGAGRRQGRLGGRERGFEAARQARRARARGAREAIGLVDLGGDVALAAGAVRHGCGVGSGREAVQPPLRDGQKSRKGRRKRSRNALGARRRASGGRAGAVIRAGRGSGAVAAR